MTSTEMYDTPPGVDSVWQGRQLRRMWGRVVVARHKGHLVSEVVWKCALLLYCFAGARKLIGTLDRDVHFCHLGRSADPVRLMKRLIGQFQRRSPGNNGVTRLVSTGNRVITISGRPRVDLRTA